MKRIAELGSALSSALGVTLALALPLLACAPSAGEIADGPDPLAALKSPAPTARYREPFWAQQSHRGTPVWKSALAFCRDEGRDRARFPNCAHVTVVSFWEAPPPFPEPRFQFGDVPAVRQWERDIAAGAAGATGDPAHPPLPTEPRP